MFVGRRDSSPTDSSAVKRDSTKFSNVARQICEPAWQPSAQLPLGALDGRFIWSLQCAVRKLKLSRKMVPPTCSGVGKRDGLRLKQKYGAFDHSPDKKLGPLLI